MNVMQLAGISAAAAMCAMVLRKLRPEMGTALALGAGALLSLLTLPMLSQVAQEFTALAGAGRVQQAAMTTLMKITGVSLLMDVAAQTCRDAGEEGLAMRTELAARAAILVLALPVMHTLLGQILSLSP